MSDVSSIVSGTFLLVFLSINYWLQLVTFVQER